MHEETSWASFSSVFKFLQQHLHSVSKGSSDAGAACSQGEDITDAPGSPTAVQEGGNPRSTYGLHDMSDDSEEEAQLDPKKQKMDA